MSSSEYPAEDQLVIATPGENEEVHEEVEA